MLALRVLLALALSFGSVPANAATKPSPTPKKSAPATKKPATKKKVVEKKPVKKKPTKKKVRKTAKPFPIPKAVWPPKGFKLSNGIYYSSPRSEKELVELLTSKKALAADLMACKEFICTVIQVASEEKCSAWQFTSKVITYDGKPLGDLISLRKGSQGKIVATYFLISKEPLQNNSEINRIITTCIRGPVVGEIPSDQFVSFITDATQGETQAPAAQ